jgi:hypothetical protein
MRFATRQVNLNTILTGQGVSPSQYTLGALLMSPTFRLPGRS